MIAYVKYATDTGRIISSGKVQGIEQVQLAAGEAVLTGFAPSDEAYVDTIQGIVVAMPARPSLHHTFDYTTKTWTLDAASAASAARKQRNRRLAESDWTQLPDAAVANLAAWQTYRQALRDVPQQPGFPETVEWPEAPA